MNMKVKNKESRNRKTPKSSESFSQSEIIKKINRNTRRSYKLFDLLIWSTDKYGK